MSMFDGKLFVCARKVPSEAFGMRCPRGPVLGARQRSNGWLCHSKSRTSVVVAVTGGREHAALLASGEIIFKQIIAVAGEEQKEV